MKKIFILVSLFGFILKSEIDIKKAVIPAAGFGTRLLPTTSIVAKELIPVNEKPAIHIVAEEAMSSGINQLFCVVSPRKKYIVDYFTIDPLLIEFLQEKNKIHYLDSLQRICNYFTVIPVIQERQLGLGHAILCAKEFITDDYFAVMLPDNIIDSEIPGIEQLILVAKKYQATVLAVEKLSAEKISLYAEMQLGEKLEENVFVLVGLREKPSVDEVVSNYSIMGRAVFHKKIFEYLSEIEPGVNGEYNWTDAIAMMVRQGEPVLVCEIKGKRFDTGNLRNWTQAVAHYNQFK